MLVPTELGGDCLDGVRSWLEVVGISQNFTDRPSNVCRVGFVHHHAALEASDEPLVIEMPPDAAPAAVPVARVSAPVSAAAAVAIAMLPLRC